MKWAGSKPLPWMGWNDFVAWAASFSLRKKVLGGFLGVLVLVGLGTSLIGTWLARDMITDLSRERLFNDLATAGYVLNSTRENLDLKIRLTAASQDIRKLVEQGNLEEVRSRLAKICAENDMDFLSVTDNRGKVIVRAFHSKPLFIDLSKDPLISAALNGRGASGIGLISTERAHAENPALEKRVGKQDRKSGMAIEAAYPLLDGKRIAGTLYGGILIDNNSRIVNRISQLVFGGKVYEKRDIGHVTIYLDDRAVSTTLKGKEGPPAPGFKAHPSIAGQVLKDGKSLMSEESRHGQHYISASEAIRDSSGNIIGAIQLATLEQPVQADIDRLVTAFLGVALVGALLMAAITYYLVQWIAQPLESLLNAARAVADGDLSLQVPVKARDELGELSDTFNLMIRNLAESRRKLEEWGKELASKVAAQTGELEQAQEQVARVKKLASLEKMADGMAHHMAHISDPLVAFGHGGDDDAAAKKILVFDQDEKVLDVCRRMLVSEGFEVFLARSTEEALKQLEEDIFDVMVSQIDETGMTGKDLLKEIKFRQPDVLVIFTAPFRSTEDAVEAVKLGAFDYIPKPFGPHQIMLMVYTALQTRAAVDFTRVEQAGQRAETIFQRLPVAIALADKEHRVVYNNRAFIELASRDGVDSVTGKTFRELFGVDPLDTDAGVEEASGSRWLELDQVGRTAKLYNFKLPEEDLRVLMLLDITDTMKKDKQADVFKAETLTRAQQVIHQQMRVAQEIAGLLGETTAETKVALFELIKLAGEEGETR